MTKTAQLVVTGDQAKHNRVNGRRGAALCSAAALLALVALAPVFASFAGPASAESFGSATFQALVSPVGVVARGSGVKAVTHPSVGRYLVQFTRSVNDNACVYTATPYGAYGGQASVQVVPGQPDTIAVFTFSRIGVPTNLYFNVLVSCNSASRENLGMTIMSASVRLDGLLLAGSGVLSSGYSATEANYFVKFNRSISGCASIATPEWEAAVAVTFSRNTYDGILIVALRDQSGYKVLRDFQLIVFCPT